MGKLNADRRPSPFMKAISGLKLWRFFNFRPRISNGWNNRGRAGSTLRGLNLTWGARLMWIGDLVKKLSDRRRAPSAWRTSRP